MASEFQSAVIEAFSFLLEQGFGVFESSPQRVEFRRGAVRISVEYDRDRSFELGVNVWAAGQTGPRYTLAEIVHFRNLEAERDFRGVQATDASVVEALLREMAGALGSAAGDLLTGDAQAFADLAAFRSQRANAFGHERDLRYRREDAGEAWARSEYERVIQLLEPIASELTPSEHKRLEIAKLKVKK